LLVPNQGGRQRIIDVEEARLAIRLERLSGNPLTIDDDVERANAAISPA